MPSRLVLLRFSIWLPKEFQFEEKKKKIQISDALSKLRATDCSTLNKWLNREEKYKWFSPEISNEILELMAHSTLRKLVSELKSSHHFGMMLDETADISCSE